jgi:hypothetical protein
MKNQYFGDVRDLFKFGLIEKIIKGLKLPQKFTYIPMLTPNDDSYDGNLRNFSKNDVGWDNEPLRVFLNQFHTMLIVKRDFREIANYYKRFGIETCIYNGNVYFEKSKRFEYFENIPQDLLENSLIFIDPDIGLEIKKSTEKHILLSEISSIYKRMNNDSAIMVFQFFPRVKRAKYIEKRLSDLSEISSNLAYITNNVILFFFLAKNQSRIEEIKGLLKEYLGL